MRIEEGGGVVVLVIVSHGMADLVSYSNAPPDHNVEQVRLFLSLLSSLLRCLFSRKALIFVLAMEGRLISTCMKLKVENFKSFCLFNYI